jgi:hypothetical protein
MDEIGDAFKYNPKTQKSTDTNLIPPSPVDFSGIEFVNAKARSHDGVMVPLVIIYKKGLKRDGRNPVLMTGYGAYGVEGTSPVYNSLQTYLPWLERGGVLVFTGVRGGGEYGEQWHLAGIRHGQSRRRLSRAAWNGRLSENQRRRKISSCLARSRRERHKRRAVDVVENGGSLASDFFKRQTRFVATRL